MAASNAGAICGSPAGRPISSWITRFRVKVPRSDTGARIERASIRDTEKPRIELATSAELIDELTRVIVRTKFSRISELMSPPEPKRRPIGFITPEEKKRG